MIRYPPNMLAYVDALQIGLDGIKCPVLFDVDIGHQPPQLTLIQGALTEIHFAGYDGRVLQTFV